RKFEWTGDMDVAFLAVKRALCESGFLILLHFNSNLPVTVACDASPVGVGAVLSHIMPDGEERPIKFASRAYRNVPHAFTGETPAVRFIGRQLRKRLELNQITDEKRHC
ncbi:MAG: hypothetical protein M3H12_06545, partial [Chromatiales bacterium]